MKKRRDILNGCKQLGHGKVEKAQWRTGNLWERLCFLVHILGGSMTNHAHMMFPMTN